MKRSYFLLAVMTFFTMLYTNRATAQQGVLLPQSEHIHGESCNHVIDTTFVPQEPQVIEGVSLRRHTDHDTTFIKGAGYVTGKFGAGESAVVRKHNIKWPVHANDRTVHGPAILIGSDYSKNAVIDLYDNDGEVIGKLKHVRFYNKGNGTEDGLTPPTWTTSTDQTTGGGFDDNHTDTERNATANRQYIGEVGYDSGNDAAKGSYSLTNQSYMMGTPVPATWWTVPYYEILQMQTDFTSNHSSSSYLDVPTIIPDNSNHANENEGRSNANNPYKKATNPGAAYYGTVFYPFKHPSPDSVTYYVLIHNHIAGWQPYNRFSFKGEKASDTLYTSTRNIDHTGWLDDKQKLRYIYPNSLNKMDFEGKLASDVKYYRPTTVLLDSVNTLDSIYVRDIHWFAAFHSGYITSTDQIGPYHAFSTATPTYCGHYSGWISYERENRAFDTVFVSSNRHIDGAVRLLDGADIYVRRDVADKTTHPYTTNPQLQDESRTDAILVLPGRPNSKGEKGNFRLKIDGNAHMLHTQDSGAYVINDPLHDGYLYHNNHGPGTPFPLTQGVSPMLAVLLGGGDQRYKEVDVRWDYSHPRELLTLTDSVTHSADSAKWMPYAVTQASVYGENGEYRGGNTIETRSIYGDTTSIIEIGLRTDSQSYFKIYSAGMLKNYRSPGISGNDTLIVGNLGDSLAPGFYLSNDSMPLYIINDGKGKDKGLLAYDSAGILFNSPGIDSINKAVKNANGKGDLHIQANRFVRFFGGDYGVSPNFTLNKQNEIKILVDQGYVHASDSITFANADSANFTIWAKGAADANRGKFHSGNGTGDVTGGAIYIDKRFTAKYEKNAVKANGLVLLRSENDDVLVKGPFEYESEAAKEESGELIVQAKQDIRVDSTILTQNGQRSILFEAGKTIAFGDGFIAKLGATGQKTNGDLTIKAGYPLLYSTADVSSPLNWGTGTIYTDADNADGYRHRKPEQDIASGGDIWFQGNAEIELKPQQSDSVDLFIRAFNSIYLNGKFKYSIENPGQFAKTSRDTVMKFAETGNIEALTVNVSDLDTVRYDIGENDSTYLLLQAGNALGDPCGTLLASVGKWKGNILFGPKKVLEINHKGVGPTLISAARDIENQVGANFTFTYTNETLSDNVTVTAGRHIETHAPYWFDFASGTNPEKITGDITMQAGRYKNGCSLLLCKEPEFGSTLGYNPGNNDNTFTEGGSGNGSILLFDSLKFDYQGKGRILLTALNGNIESDPYLHGSYPGGAPIIINHKKSEGITRLEAINIKLHDRIDYIADEPANDKNGQFYMAAFDSILTRNLKYTNPTDAGSVYITTDKYKDGAPCYDESSNPCATTGAIRQGHIVLGYGADKNNLNANDSIIFDFNKDGNNANTAGRNVYILAGFEGFEKNPITGKIANAQLFGNDKYGLDLGKGKGYGGNITFDYAEFYMPTGSGSTGGSTRIATPNGNIWGKDSILYRGRNGDLNIDAGQGSVDDVRAILWKDAYATCERPEILNTKVPFLCGDTALWRTGNIMMKGAHLNFDNSGTAGTGNAIFRTREGFIDMYDAFTAENMSGDLLLYAGMDNLAAGNNNSFGDVSMRDFTFKQVAQSGSVFIGADDNIMLNYGNSNTFYDAYGKGNKGYPGQYDVSSFYQTPSKWYYSTFYKQEIATDTAIATYDVNKDGYLFYKNGGYTNRHHNRAHQMYRGSTGAGGNCVLKENGARELYVNYEVAESGANINSGGFAAVATNYIDLFTKFTYFGGTGTGLGNAPGMSNLHGENVNGFGLFIKSQYTGDGNNKPESRRATCEKCDQPSYPTPIEFGESLVKTHYEMTYVGFHDEARIHTQNQKSWIEAPVIEFFGHAELDAYNKTGAKTNITLKADSLIFHDSIIFDGLFRSGIDFVPFTTDEVQRNNDMRYGVINDRGRFVKDYANDSRDVLGYEKMGPAITMEDRGLPVLEIGYQRCTEPGVTAHPAPNANSAKGKESTPSVGGDVILAFKHDFKLPMFNTVVANNARISFLTDSFDHVLGGEYINAFIRTDLLRIRNKVEFYTDPAQPKYRSGKFVLADHAYMDELMNDAGMYVNHLHTEPGSELSIPGEDSLIVWAKTTLGGYGNVHETVFVKNGGILAPGYASLMESDCATPPHQGKLTVHDLTMEQYAIIRTSVGDNGVDVLSVQDSLFFKGKISVFVMPAVENLMPGCYLFMEYGDSLGVSSEYARNLILLQQRYNDVYYSLDFSQPGKVMLCISRIPPPDIQRYVDLPLVDGVTYNYVKINGQQAIHNVGRNYVRTHQDFEMNLSFTGVPQKVWAQGFYSSSAIDLDATAQINSTDGSYTYIIRQVVESYTINFGPQLSTVATGNNVLTEGNVWTYRNTLYINVPVEEVVSIYNITGVLNRKLDVPSGLTKLTLDRGAYIVTLRNGKVYKIMVK